MRPQTWTTMILALLLWAPPTRGHDLEHGNIHIGHAWAKPAAKGETTEAYFPIINRGDEADRLIGARTKAAGRVFLAETLEDGLVAPREAIELPPRRPVALRPGGLHVRLEKLTTNLNAGDSFALTLLFANAPPAEMAVAVETTPGD